MAPTCSPCPLHPGHPGSGPRQAAELPMPRTVRVLVLDTGLYSPGLLVSAASRLGARTPALATPIPAGSSCWSCLSPASYVRRLALLPPGAHTWLT